MQQALRQIHNKSKANQFFMKLLFCTGDINIVQECQLMFHFKLPSEKLKEYNFIRKYDIYVMNCSSYD